MVPRLNMGLSTTRIQEIRKIPPTSLRDLRTSIECIEQGYLADATLRHCRSSICIGSDKVCFDPLFLKFCNNMC